MEYGQPLLPGPPHQGEVDGSRDVQHLCQRNKGHVLQTHHPPEVKKFADFRATDLFRQRIIAREVDKSEASNANTYGRRWNRV